MKIFQLRILCSLACLSLCVALELAVAAEFGDQPANSKLALEDDFERSELGKGWNTTTGEWTIVDGALRGREIPKEEHSAATRRVIESSDAVYELSFRFVEQGKAFHFGFDPARGELTKKGHLFSVIATRDDFKILKHVDKNRREEDPNETLAAAKAEFKTNQWYKMRVTTWGKYVTVRIDGQATLKASHPTFGVKKPTLVFRCLGDGVEIDDIRVWTRQ